MATAAKPGAGKGPAAADKTGAPPAKKSSKMLVIIIVLVLLLGGGGAAAYFLMKPAGAGGTEKKAAQEIPPTYVALGTFTANLLHEDGADRYLQVAISVKITKPKLEEEIKARNPEILDHVNMLLSSRRPSMLATVAGKEKLARDIKAQIELVLGLRHAVPASDQTQAASAPVAEPVQAPTGIEQVLFTSFIIQ
jgi:flagellar FliL protein